MLGDLDVCNAGGPLWLWTSPSHAAAAAATAAALGTAGVQAGVQLLQS